MTIDNNKKLKLEDIEKALKKKLPDYDYKIVNNVVLVSKTESIQLNVIVEEETVQVVEAVEFVNKLAIAIGTIGLAFYFMQTMEELSIWIRIVVYLLAFLVGGLLGDLLHKARYAKQYKTFKPKVEGVVMKVVS